MPKKKKTKKTYRLPSRVPGTSLKTENVYDVIEAWRNIAEPLADYLDCDLIGFDPGIYMVTRNGKTPFTLPEEVAFKLKDALDLLEQAKKILNKS